MPCEWDGESGELLPHPTPQLAAHCNRPSCSDQKPGLEIADRASLPWHLGYASSFNPSSKAELGQCNQCDHTKPHTLEGPRTTQLHEDPEVVC